MSWAITINNIQSYDDFPIEIVENMLTQHIAYPGDMRLALDAAKKAGLGSATLGGARTPNPYAADEIVTITITGHARAVDFVTEMKKIVAAADDIQRKS